MNHIPCILFDKNSEIIYSTVSTQENLREVFLRAMRKSDRIRFDEFCSAPFNPASPGYCLYQLDGFPDAEYVFAEKDVLRSEEITIAYLAADPSDFYQLFSPTSALFREITGRCIADILSPEALYDLTPEGYLTLDRIPHLRDELTAEEQSTGFCSIRRVAEEIADAFSHVPSFSHINLISDADHNELIVPIPLCSYVFLFTALLSIFHTLAEDHVINVSLTEFNTGFAVTIAVSRSREIDSGSFDCLGELSPSTENLARISSAIAFRSGLRTSVICSGTSLTADISLRENEIEEPHFHYRDPYSEIPAMVGEYLGFIESILASSGDQTQCENENLGTESV